MLKKRRFQAKNRVRVTFILADAEAGSVHLVGDFNDWSTAHGMKRVDDAWTTSIDLEPGRTYQFRYLADGERWVNDARPDAYAPNPYGGENSVVTT